MSILRSTTPKLHFEYADGSPLAGGWLYTYLAGTSTPVATYADRSGTRNPVQIQLDSRGECDVWLDSSQSYKFVLLDPLKSQPPIWVEDYITVSSGSGGGGEQLTAGPNISISPSGVISTESVVLREGHNVSISSSFDPQTRKITYVVNAGGGSSYSAGEAIVIGTGNAINVNYGFGLKVNANNQLEATGDLRDAGTLDSADSIEVPNNAVSRVTTTLYANTVTLNVTVASETDVPNFAVMVHAAANATLYVTKTIHEAEDIITPIRYSVDAGNELVAGKTYQVTCVGDCWTLAEFAVPADATYTFGGLVVQVVAGEGSAEVTDGSDLVKVTEPVEVSSFSYDRTFTSGVKGTIVLPFSLSDASKITSGNLYEIVDVAFDGEVYSGVLGNSPVTAVEANHPYVYEPTTSGPITISLSAGETLTLVPTPDETTTTLQTSNGTWLIHGTYVSISDFGDLPNFENRALYAYSGVTTESINAGDFGRIGPGASISPMRLYLERVIS